MKDYREMAESVFEKGDKILAERQKRHTLIRNMSFSSAGVCAVLFVAFTVWHDPDLKKAPEPDSQPDTIIIEETNSTSKKTTAAEFSTEHSSEVEKTTVASYTIINSITSSKNTTSGTIYNSIPVSTASSYTIYNSIPTSTATSSAIYNSIPTSTSVTHNTTVERITTVPTGTVTSANTTVTTGKEEDIPEITHTTAQTTKSAETTTRPVSTKKTTENVEIPVITTGSMKTDEALATTACAETTSKECKEEIIPADPTGKVDGSIIRRLENGETSVYVHISIVNIDLAPISEEAERLSDEYIESILDRGYSKKKLDHYRDVFYTNKRKELAEQKYMDMAYEIVDILGVEEYTIDLPDVNYITKPYLCCKLTDISQVETAEECDLISKVWSV